jgi:hypothetical protein
MAGTSRKKSLKSSEQPEKPIGPMDWAIADKNLLTGLEALDSGEQAFQNWLDQMYPGTQARPLAELEQETKEWVNPQPEYGMPSADQAEIDAIVKALTRKR